MGGYHPFDPARVGRHLASRIKQGKWQFHDEAWEDLPEEGCCELLAVKLMTDGTWTMSFVTVGRQERLIKADRQQRAAARVQSSATDVGRRY